MKPLADIPSNQQRSIRPLLGKWIAEGKQVSIGDAPKDVIDMVSIHPDIKSFNRLTYYIDPQLVPAIKVGVAEGQGAGMATGTR